MRERPAIIKAINALKSASLDEPIHHIPYISETMALELVSLGYATRAPWSQDPAAFCYCLTTTGLKALEAKPEPKTKLPTLQPRIPTLPQRLK
ncbi:MAG: hypothetical protein LCH47_11180 [Proteobacteria bacterium]|nr:hypothetical protein [Pseudomonadota bacterium]